MNTSRPFRFSVAGGPFLSSREEVVELARRAEGQGVAGFSVADHLSGPMSPLIVLAALAEETTTLRLCTLVLSNDFRHPAVLAKEVATLDLLSGGRLELGMGSGWLKQDYDRAGIAFDDASVRIGRLEESVQIIKGLLSSEPFSFEGLHYTIREMFGSPKPLQHPHPPILVGARTRQGLGVAGRHADAANLAVRTTQAGRISVDDITAGATNRKLHWLRTAAGDRFGMIEVGVTLVAISITEQRSAAARELLRCLADYTAGPLCEAVTEQDILASPYVALGTVGEICEHLSACREHFGISHFTISGAWLPEFAPVIGRLAGR